MSPLEQSPLRNLTDLAQSVDKCSHDSITDSITTYTLLPGVKVHTGRGSICVENDLSLVYSIEGRLGFTSLFGRNAFHTTFYDKGQLQIIEKDQRLDLKNKATCLQIDVTRNDLRRWQEAGKLDLESGTSILTEKRFSNVDSRRTIVDVTPQVKLFYIAHQEGLCLGNHYHCETNEFYFVVQGRLDWKLESVNFIPAMECDEGCCEEELRMMFQRRLRRSYIVEAGQMLHVPTHMAHVVQPASGTIFVGVLDHDFDAKDIFGYNV